MIDKPRRWTDEHVDELCGLMSMGMGEKAARAALVQKYGLSAILEKSRLRAAMRRHNLLPPPKWDEWTAK